MSTLVAQTISNGTVSTSSANVISGSARAWVSYSGTTTTVRASYNVSSVTRTSQGNYTINFTNAFIDQYYSVSGTCQPNGDGKGDMTLTWNQNPTASACYITTCALSGNQVSQDSAYIGFQAWR